MRSITERFRRQRPESGAAAVEFVLISVLLFTLVFGIITFGVLYGYRQQLTQAAAEGARTAVPVSYTTSSYSTLQEAARLQVNRSLSGSKRQCPSPLVAGTSGSLTADGITCSFLVYPCTASTPGVGSPTGADDCIQVKVVLDNNTKPLVPKLPFLAVMTPSSLTATYVAKLAGWAGT
jgi:Flp pilus assembly protein TadG